MLTTILLILIGTLLILEGWKLHIIISLIGFGIAFLGVHKSNEFLDLDVLFGRIVVSYIVILTIAIFILPTLVPNIKPLDVFAELTLGFLIIVLIIISYKWC